MKSRTKLALGLAVGLAQAFMADAQDQFVLTWRGTAYLPGAGGKIATSRFSEKDIIQKVALDNGLNAGDLALVYRVQARDTAVVQKANGAFVADVIQLQYSYTDVTNATDTVAVRQAMLNDEAHPNPIGSAFGNESTKRDANGNLKTYSFHGTFQYAIPETATVYSGTFATGKRLNDTSGGSSG